MLGIAHSRGFSKSSTTQNTGKGNGTVFASSDAAEAESKPSEPPSRRVSGLSERLEDGANNLPSRLSTAHTSASVSLGLSADGTGALMGVGGRFSDRMSRYASSISLSDVATSRNSFIGASLERNYDEHHEMTSGRRQHLRLSNRERGLGNADPEGLSRLPNPTSAVLSERGGMILNFLILTEDRQATVEIMLQGKLVILGSIIFGIVLGATVGAGSAAFKHFWG